MVNFKVTDTNLEFKTSEEVFSPSNIDKGTLAMIKQVQFHEDDRLLDLGCGYGFVGIYASTLINSDNITMCDINESAVKLSKYNAKHNGLNNIHILKSNGLNNINEDNFSLILSNPPYHEDFSVPKEFIEDGYKKLSLGGRMYMVTKRKDWYKNKLISVFGGVKISEADGYYIFMAEKQNSAHPSKSKKKLHNNLSKKLQRKMIKMHH